MALQRDESNFLLVLKAHKGIVYKVANCYCRNEENKKDLIQEITLQLWLSFPKYDETYRLSTWIYRIALNVAISYYRKENRREQINHPLSLEIMFLTEEPQAEWHTQVEQLYQLIKELKEIDRAIMLLYLDGNAQKDIAEVLGLTPTNISTKVARIKQQLTQQFSRINS